MIVVDVKAVVCFAWLGTDLFEKKEKRLLNRDFKDQPIPLDLILHEVKVQFSCSQVWLEDEAKWMLQCSSSFYHLDLRNVFRCVNGFLKRIFKYLDKCLKWVRSNLDKTSLLTSLVWLISLFKLVIASRELKYLSNTEALWETRPTSAWVMYGAWDGKI